MLKYNQKVKVNDLVGTVFARKSELKDGLNVPTDSYYIDIAEKDNKNFREKFPTEKTKGILLLAEEKDIICL